MSNYKDYNWSEGETCAGIIANSCAVLFAGYILDVGCGNGFVANKLNEMGFTVYGIDASISGIELARMNFPDRYFVQNIDPNQLPREIQEVYTNSKI
jgi:2-polyprenyl-3-methyl-5-hydroxy-6-metoxy-1,4-benzoquinol methylase